jgi:hypothetical protein
MMDRGFPDPSNVKYKRRSTELMSYSKRDEEALERLKE